MVIDARTAEMERVGENLVLLENEHLVNRLFNDYISGNWYMGTRLTPEAAKDKIVEQFKMLSSFAVQGICDKIN